MDKRPAFLLVMLLIILFSGCIAVSGTMIDYTNWASLTTVILLVAYFIIALVYMLASIMQMPVLFAWAKNELYQTTASALIFGLMLIALPLAQMVYESIADSGNYRPAKPGGPRGADAFEEAGNYIYQKLLVLEALYYVLAREVFWLSLIMSAGITARPGGVGATLNPFLILRPIADTANTLLRGVSLGIGLMYMQSFILDFVKSTMLTLFFPLGIALRSFPYTRRAGGACIAIAVGFYFVYPLTFMMDNVLTQNYYSTTLCNADDILRWETPIKALILIRPGAGTLVAVIFNLGFELITGHGIALAEHTPPGSSEAHYRLEYSGTTPYEHRALIVQEVWRLMGTRTAVSSITAIGSPGGVMNCVVYSVVVTAVVLPAINVFLTLTFIRGIALILGTDVNLGAIVRMI